MSVQSSAKCGYAARPGLIWLIVLLAAVLAWQGRSWLKAAREFYAGWTGVGWEYRR